MLCYVFSPTCQVGVSRFYQSCFPPPPSPPLAASDLNCELQISVGTAEPQTRAPDISGHCWTSTASARCQIECHKEGQIECQNIRQIECQMECQNICQIECQI